MIMFDSVEIEQILRGTTFLVEFDLNSGDAPMK